MKESQALRINLNNISMQSKKYMEEYHNAICYLMSQMTDEATCYTGLFIKINTDTEDYKKIFDLCLKRGLEIEIAGHSVKYTKKELKEANYFRMTIGNMGAEDYSESYDTKYKAIFTCEKCGRSVYRQVSPLVINKSLMKGKDIGVTTNNEIVVSERLKNAIEEDKLTGIHFASVQHYRNTKREFPEYYQMFIDSVMPEMDENTLFTYDRPKYCDVCQKYGRILPTFSRYKKNKLINIKDFNWTFERLGGGYLGQQQVIITQKVYQLWKELKIRNCRFEIVMEDE